MTIGSRLV